MGTGEIIGVAAGVVAAVVAVIALWAQLTTGTGRRDVSVTVAYEMPVWGNTHAPEFRDDDQVSIVVTNRGNAPVAVLNYGVSLDGKRNGRNLFVLRPVPWSTRLPATVDPGGEPVTVRVPVEDLERAHTEHGVPFSSMRPWVDLGDGRRVFADRSVPLK